MSNSGEKCQNCSEIFYQQSLFPLEYVDFAFGGQNITLIGCFVESTSKTAGIPQCPKICRCCLELLRSSFLGNDYTLLMNDDKSTTTTHICATCSGYFPTKVMLSMQLAMINFEGQSVKLAECYKTCTNQEVPNKDGLMACLACVSAMADSYSRRTLSNLNSSFKEIKVEPLDSMDPKQLTDNFLEVKCKIEPELLIENCENERRIPEADFKPVPEPVSLPATKSRGRKRKGQFLRLTPADAPDLFKSLADPYECSFCKEGFRQRRQLMEHLMSHRKDVVLQQKITDTNMECPICKQTMTSRYCLKRHLIRSHYLNSTYRCHHCTGFKTLTKANMEEHLQLRHFEIEQKCPDCPTVLPNRKDFLKHIRVHKLGTLQCPGCKRCFKRPSQYRTHLKINKTVINCKQCEAAFHSVRALDVHMQTSHGFVFTCEVCKVPLSKRDNYNAHMRIQHSILVKPSCKICAKEFEYTEELVAHENAEHASRNYICETCGQNFTTRSTMLSHIRFRHPDSEEVLKESCHICGKVLKKKSMRNHLKMHTEGKTQKVPKLIYTCPQCPQWKFTRHQHLEGHMIIHNTENRSFFQCSSCGIAYTRRQKFDIHVRKCFN